MQEKTFWDQNCLSYVCILLFCSQRHFWSFWSHIFWRTCLDLYHPRYFLFISFVCFHVSSGIMKIFISVRYFFNINSYFFFLLLKIMQALVEHYSTKGWLQRVEQCVLHMDISSLDFNQVYIHDHSYKFSQLYFILFYSLTLIYSSIKILTLTWSSMYLLGRF